MSKLTLLETVEEFYGKVSLNNTLLIACQHLLGTQLEMFNHLVAYGLKPENCYIIGKNYSTNRKVYNKLKEDGFNVAKASIEFDYSENFDDWFEDKINELLDFISCHVIFDQFQKIVFLDDGGHLIEAAHRFNLPKDKVVAIEQTSSGFNRLKRFNLEFPVSMVARMNLKLIYETPFITKLALERITSHLSNRDRLSPKVLVIGKGPIGASLKTRLDLLAIENKIFDIKDNPGGVIGEFGDKIKDFNVIIGATGEPVFTEQDLDKLNPEVSLISVSSSDREFPSAFIRTLSGNQGLHGNYYLNGKCLVNAGFPITFYGNYHELSPKLIELTCSLLYASILMHNLKQDSEKANKESCLYARLAQKFIERLNENDY